MEEELLIALRPVVEAIGLELVDVERRAGVLAVTVDRDGGIDLDALTAANRALSRALDELDPIPGRYSLEVSSPGLERPLRTPAHFARAVGETITVKTRPQVPGERRRRGRLVAADDAGFEFEPEDPEGEDAEIPGTAETGHTIHLSYSDIDRARTVFEWGPATAGERRAGGRDAAAGQGTTTKPTAKSGRRTQSGPSGKSGKSGQRGKQVVNR